MLRLFDCARIVATACVCGLLVSLPGCAKTTSGGTPPKVAPTVKVIEPIERELPDFVEFTGWTDAVESVEIRARVNGYLKHIAFKAGKEVEAGELLFEIDPRPYAATVAQSEGALATVKARLKRTAAELDRTQGLREKGINTQADFDKAVADQAEAVATLQSSEASLEKAKLDLGFTKVTAPVAGRTSRERITVGNLVTADSTLLTTIVSLDPIYAYFDVDERTMLDIQQRIREKKMKSARDHDDVEVKLGLANESGFPHIGVLDLVDNRISATTGTIQVRGRFSNADRLLTPGLFVRIQFQMGPPRSRVLIPEQALAQQQGQRYVFVVKPDNTVERRDVSVGRKDGSLRVIETGLQVGEKVIVQGQLRVRPGIVVKAELFQEPASAAAASPSAVSR